MKVYVARGMLLAALLLPSACGGGSSSGGHTSAAAKAADFKTALTSAVNNFKTTSGQIGTAIVAAPKETDAQIGTAFQTLATNWQSDVSKLQTLKPPANLATEFNTLSAAATRAETDLTSIVSAAKTHSASAAEQASASLVTDVLAAKTASQALESKLGK